MSQHTQQRASEFMKVLALVPGESGEDTWNEAGGGHGVCVHARMRGVCMCFGGGAGEGGGDGKLHTEPELALMRVV